MIQKYVRSFKLKSGRTGSFSFTATIADTGELLGVSTDGFIDHVCDDDANGGYLTPDEEQELHHVIGQITTVYESEMIDD